MLYTDDLLNICEGIIIARTEKDLAKFIIQFTLYNELKGRNMVL